MRKLFLTFCVAAAAAFGADYTLGKAGTPPQELAPAIRDALQPDGLQVAGPSGVVCDVWWRKDAPAAKNNEDNVSFTDIAHGTLLGVIRFPSKGQDRRGQAIAAGVYTMRLSFFPVDGAHQGISQTRDFVLVSPAAGDTDVNATPNFAQLMTLSKKASHTTHPAVLNVWKAESGEPALKHEGEDWVLYGTAGGRPIALIVVGQFAG